MFILDGKPLSPDVAFTDPATGVQYPANFLRLSTLEEKEAIGITEQADPPVWDQRFAWGYSEDGQLIWKDHTQLVEQWVAQTRTTAGTLLAPTDWVIIREADNGKAADPALKQLREDIRLATGQKNAAIEATTDTAELAAYITGSEYPVWPSDSPAPVEPAPVDGLEPLLAINPRSDD
jgi:hypothetical protein